MERDEKIREQARVSVGAPTRSPKRGGPGLRSGLRVAGRLRAG